MMVYTVTGFTDVQVTICHSCQVQLRKISDPDKSNMINVVL